MKPNDRKRGIILTKAYYSKFAGWDFPEWYRNITNDKNYDTLEGYIRALKKMNDRDFMKEIVNNTLYNMKEFRKERKKDPAIYYSLGAGNIYTNF